MFFASQQCACKCNRCILCEQCDFLHKGTAHLHHAAFMTMIWYAMICKALVPQWQISMIQIMGSQGMYNRAKFTINLVFVIKERKNESKRKDNFAVLSLRV